jgi:hypothetical protein
MDITELLKSPEGKTLEFKRDLSAKKGILRTLVAFANTSALRGFFAFWWVLGCPPIFDSGGLSF